jgi:hypothetical protein
METLTGKHARAAMNGTLFSACNPTPKTTVAGAAAAGWTGLGVCNPTGSGIHIVVHEFYYSKYKVADVEGALGLATTTDAGFAAEIVPKNRLIGGAASKAYADSAATITTAGNLIAWVANFSHEGEDDDGYLPSNGVIDLQGALVLPPGYSVITFTDAVQTVVFTFGFMWEEVQSPFGS